LVTKARFTKKEPPLIVTRYNHPRPRAAPRRNSTMSSTASVSSKSSPSRPSLDSGLSRRTSVTLSDSAFTWSSNFEVTPMLTKTPWELERGKRRSTLSIRQSKCSSTRSLPAHFFQNLPQEIYDCVLQQLEHLYFDSGSECCPSCYLKDVHSLALTSRAWN